MDVIVERCCGLDVHEASVTACLIVGSAGRKPRREVRAFRTLTRELMQMRDWLRAEGCTHIGMESTGVYWKPVYAVLEEDDFELIVGNANHIRNVPGRKTDVKDAEWLADLVRHGFIKKSFVPPRPIRELRDLVRYRRKLVESRTAERNRLLKLLETANIKLASVASDVFGVSGMLMLRALVEGRSNPSELASLAKGRLRDKRDDLTLALEGRVEDHHRFILRLQLRRLDGLQSDLEHLESEIDRRLEPYKEQRVRLTQIPGVDRVVAATLIAEIGTDMSVFHGPNHLAAWAGVCPGNNESAGKRKAQHVRKGNLHLQSALVEAATAASRKKNTYLKDKYWRLKARRGTKRAAMAIAHKILIAAYQMLATGADYKELGVEYLDRLDKTRTARNLVRRLERLGFQVAVKQSIA